MANHVSALKRARQTETRTEVNRANRSRVRTSLRALREALTKGDAKAAQEQLPDHRFRARQERAERRSALQHRFPIQEPPERARQRTGDAKADQGCQGLIAPPRRRIKIQRREKPGAIPAFVCCAARGQVEAVWPKSRPYFAQDDRVFMLRSSDAGPSTPCGRKAGQTSLGMTAVFMLRNSITAHYSWLHK